MKIFNHVSTVLLGLFALSHAIPAPVAVESMAIEQRGIDVESEAGAKVAENILQDTFQKMKAIDKKYMAYKRITLNDIGQWQSEVRTCVTNFTGTCNGNTGCNVLDLTSLSKVVFDLLKELNLTFVGLCGKGGGLLGLEGILYLVIGLLCSGLIESVLALVSSLLSLNGGVGLLSILGPQLGNAGGTLGFLSGLGLLGSILNLGKGLGGI